MARKRGPTIRTALLRSSREAALNAVQSFNNPLAEFRTETFIVLMIIAWTYLLHAYFRMKGIEYRCVDRKATTKRYERTRLGAYKYWSLRQCLNADYCPLDSPTRNNLLFLIGLRNEIEHHMSAGTATYFAGRYLACCLNYERYVCELFGERHSLGNAVVFTLQFRDLQKTGRLPGAVVTLPSRVAQYVTEFDEGLSDDDVRSPSFRRRFLFTPLTTTKRGQADEVVEFVRQDSELGKMIGEAHTRVMLKEVEKSKYRPGQIVQKMKDDGYVRFNMHHHTALWKNRDAKKPEKGYGVNVAGTWYWYDRWVQEVRDHCADNAARFANR